MKTRTPSRNSLKAHIDTLRRRHREIDARTVRMGWQCLFQTG